MVGRLVGRTPGHEAVWRTNLFSGAVSELTSGCLEFLVAAYRFAKPCLTFSAVVAFISSVTISRSVILPAKSLIALLSLSPQHG